MSEARTTYAAQGAELDDLKGQGYLAVRTQGYRRCEGTFRCRRAERPAVKAMLETYPTYRGVVYQEGKDIGWRTLSVRIRAFHEEPGSLVVEIQAVGPWWEDLNRQALGS